MQEIRLIAPIAESIFHTRLQFRLRYIWTSETIFITGKCASRKNVIKNTGKRICCGALCLDNRSFNRSNDQQSSQEEFQNSVSHLNGNSFNEFAW